MFKKTTRAKNIRRKIDTSDDEKEPETVVSQTKIEKKKKQKPRSLGLSFDQEEDGDGETFQVKKSSASRRIASGQRKLAVPPIQPTTATTAATIDTTTMDEQQPSSYTSEVLESLRKSTPSRPAHIGAMDDVVEKFPNLMTAQVGSTSIPSANAIHAAKMKREQMRKGIVVHEEEDFVALDDSTEQKRLVREEDEIGDDGEAEYEQYVGERLTLNKKAARKLEAERKANAREMIAEAQEDEEDDDQMEDIERWESNLIRHGAVRPQRQQEQQRDPYAPPPGYRPALVPTPTQIPALDEAMQHLDIVSNDLNQILQEYDTQLTQMEQNKQNLQSAELDLGNDILRSSERYEYFQSLSSYVNDLGEFLDAKFPELEALEKEAHDLIAAKHAIISKRRWEDDMDDLHEFAHVPEKMDEEQQENGRMQYQREGSQRRKEERQRRIEERQDLMDVDPADVVQEQGLWSDDDLEEEWSVQHEEKLDNIQDNKVPAMLEDVGEEFESMEAVKSKFEAWKTRFYDDYTKAFGSLSLPGAFEFFVRCELVSWDPFSQSTEFESMRWHTILSQYGITEHGDDADAELLSKIVEKVLIKKVKSMLDTLNIASTKEMRYAAQVVEQISYYVEKHDRAYQDLISAVENTIDEQLKAYADLMDTITLQHNNKAKERFFWRQCKYLKTLHVWRRHLPKETIKSLASVVMNRILAPILQPAIDPSDAPLQREALHLVERLE
ncbi:hypothetical protein O0I10_011206 [Lichtheimia ornata]|uniref:GCF C-terminal domain-containing protein n=1 Tax=Lichtheimia ornata TaxID=688661 RepID=A0AAD7UTG1_9FUNG|nr:uncharacterized protein O0I10_011206 [Lichtheimia ornata]KAJ8653157.1 hypothetical protein O0I10_011206 [Lichtheimia ornata]